MPQSKPSPVSALSQIEESDPLSPDFSALQTLALAHSLCARLELGHQGIQIANEPALTCSEDSIKVLKMVIANNDAEIQDALVDSYVWMGEMEVLELCTMPYPEYLKTEHWLETREMALAMVANRCQICNSPEKLHVHHRTYENRGREQSIDLTVLCSVCHQLFHDHGRLVK